MISLTEPVFEGNELSYVMDCIQSGWVSSKGGYIQRFEEAMANWCGVRHGIATSSGTTAIHLALIALDIGPGDEVIVPAFSYIATANAIKYTGARPVFIEADASTWNLDLHQVECKITSHTKAIIVVHTYGHPVDMDALEAIITKYSLWIIDDASEAHGTKYKGRQAGSLGHVGCFSFYGNKLITTGEGGMLVTESTHIAEKVRLLRNQSSEGNKYWHSRIGFSYRMSNLQAALGLAQVERIAQLITARCTVFHLYDELLKDTPGITLYVEPGWSQGVCWLYSLLLEDEFGSSRDELIDYLAKNGIESKPFFHSIPSLPPYSDGQTYPIAEHLSCRGINLPTSGKLQPQQIEYIVRVLRQAPFDIFS
jgi:perosamine synthetase